MRQCDLRVSQCSTALITPLLRLNQSLGWQNSTSLRAGMSSRSSGKVSRWLCLWCLTTGSIKEGRFTWKCFGKHNWSFKQAEGWCVFVDVTHSVYIHLFYLSLVWESLLFFTVLSPVFALSFLGCTQSGGGVTQVSLLVHKSFPMRERVIRGSHTLVQTNKHELLWWKAWIAAKLLTLYCILRIFNTCLLWLHGHYARVGNG